MKGLNSKLDNRKKYYCARKQVNRKIRPEVQIQKKGQKVKRKNVRDIWDISEKI